MLPQKKKNIYIFSTVTLFIVVEVSHEIYIYILTYTTINNVTAENIYIHIFCGNIIYSCVG